MIDISRATSWFRVFVVLIAVIGESGCATMDRSVALAEQAVTPIIAGSPRVISAYDLADAMLRAGFTHEQVLADGPAIRTALATSGGAQVRYGKVTSALFAIEGDLLYITSVERGTFTLSLTGSPT